MPRQSKRQLDPSVTSLAEDEPIWKKKIRMIVAAHGGNEALVSIGAGRSRTWVRDQLERNASIRASSLEGLAKFAGKPVSWFFTDDLEDGARDGRPDEPYEFERVPLEENNGNGYHDGWEPSVPGGLPQLDARAGAGDGALGAVVTLSTGGITSGHLVTQEWLVPRTVLGTAPARVFALPVDGTSMEPGLSTDDVVFVEPTERIKSGEIYVIDDGDGPMVKRLRIDRNEEPPRLWITSDNPAVPEFWRPLEAVRVIGQVIGKFVRMRSR
jgi:hypothetical protein